MSISESYEIDYARIDINNVYTIFGENGKYQKPLVFKEPIGIYTISPHAIYAGRRYQLGFKVSNIELKGKLNIYDLTISNASVTHTPYYDADLDMLIATVQFNPCDIPELDVMKLPDSLWKSGDIMLKINGQVVNGLNEEVISIPIAFDTYGGVPSGDVFYNRNKAFMVIRPGETVCLDITSGGAGGAGLNLTKGENNSGEFGGDATLCYIEPETNLVKPIVFLEGGLGGRLSTHAYQDFKERTAKTKVFVNGHVVDNITTEVIVDEHHKPSRDLKDTSGGTGHLFGNDTVVATGGTGGYKEEIGFRGEGGMSGARATVFIKYPSVNAQPGGPFIVLHPKTFVNAFNVITDKDLKIKKTKTPMIGGQGGDSLTVSGTDGQSGTLFIGVQNG